MSREIVKWGEISGTAEYIFNFWVDQPELKWAEKAWQAMVKAKLAHYDNEIERHDVLIRLMTLGVMYLEFCYKAWEEYSEPQLTDWANMLDLSEFRIGQMVGETFESEILEEYIDDDFDIIEYALKELIDQSRSEILIALLKYFKNDAGLFVSLYATNTAEWDENDPEESQYQILTDFDLDDTKLEAFQWITDQMPALYW